MTKSLIYLHGVPHIDFSKLKNPDILFLVQIEIDDVGGPALVIHTIRGGHIWAGPDKNLGLHYPV